MNRSTTRYLYVLRSLKLVLECHWGLMVSQFIIIIIHQIIASNYLNVDDFFKKQTKNFWGKLLSELFLRKIAVLLAVLPCRWHLTPHTFIVSINSACLSPRSDAASLSGFAVPCWLSVPLNDGVVVVNKNHTSRTLLRGKKSSLQEALNFLSIN